jgi:hypothetical protein
MEPFTVTRESAAKTIQKSTKACINKYIYKLQLFIKLTSTNPTESYEI